MRKLSLIVVIAAAALVVLGLELKSSASLARRIVSADAAPAPRNSPTAKRQGLSEDGTQFIIRFASNPQPMPPFLLGDLDGEIVSTASWRGKVVLLNFWATWCPPCVDEAPSLNQLQRRIAPLGGTVLGVSEDEDPSAYETFLKTYSLGFPTYRDPVKGKIALEYGTSMYPETYIIDRRGRIDRKIVGEQDWSSPEINSYLASLLK